MKNLLISILILSFSISAYADDSLSLTVRKIWPEEIKTVGEISLYFLEVTKYELFLNDDAKAISELYGAALPDNDLHSIESILLDVLPSQFSLIIDKEHKLVSFGVR